jgi:hypothetical protein
VSEVIERFELSETLERDNLLLTIAKSLTPALISSHQKNEGKHVCDRPQNEFIWIRTYKDKAELEAKTKEFQAAVVAAGVKLGANVAKMEVREAESAFA